MPGESDWAQRMTWDKKGCVWSHDTASGRLGVPSSSCPQLEGATRCEVVLGHYNPVTIFGRRSLSMFLVFEYRKYLLGGLSRKRAQTG